MSLWSRIERRLSDLAGDLIPDEFRGQLDEARALIARGEAEQAVELLAAMLADRPSHTGALTMLGAAQLALGDGEAAQAAFDGALAEDGQLAEAHLGRGEALMLRGELRGAAGSFHTAVNNAGGERDVLAEAYRGLGLAYLGLGDLDKAIRELRKAVTENAGDKIALAALGNALLDHDETADELAERYLSRATDGDDVPAAGWLGVGRLALREGRYAAAIDALERVDSDDVRVDALLNLAAAQRAIGNASEAHQRYLQALELQPKRADIHAGIGDIHANVNNDAAALASYRRSLDLAFDVDVAHRAMAVAVRASDMDAAVQLANEVLQTNPDDAQALVARATALVEQGELDAARATFRLVLESGDNVDAHTALGQLELAADRSPAGGQRAAAEALNALRLAPAHEPARALLARARQRELLDDVTALPATQASTNADLYNFARKLHDVAMRAAPISHLAPQLAAAATSLDQPLLVTVMGEFSSGKSSFVNAFIGTEVAPTGITPTTATINVVKYGRERGGRIIHRDGTVETVAWESLFSVLSGLDGDRARGVELVEILLPLEALQRVSIVDTPGLNSILPEHEQIARDFIHRADAVVWLFTSQQAGKSSEREALDEIRSEGKRVLGVLNKRDQLEPEQVDELVEYVTGELGERVEVIVPFSARDAMSWRSRGDGGDDDGNWANLAAALETRFFARARELKRDAANKRLTELLAEADGLVAGRSARARASAGRLGELAEQLRQQAGSFGSDTAQRERQTLVTDAAAMFERAAGEVLELVRPRRLPFGSHQATEADRDYLIALLDEGYGGALERSAERVATVLRDCGQRAANAALDASAVVGGEAVSDIERTVEASIELVSARVFARCQAYLQGYVRGGYVDTFFRTELPKLELTPDSVYHVLFRRSPDLDQQIARPLTAAGEAAINDVATRLRHWSSVADVMAYDLEVGVGRALQELTALHRSME